MLPTCDLWDVSTEAGYARETRDCAHVSLSLLAQSFMIPRHFVLGFFIPRKL